MAKNADVGLIEVDDLTPYLADIEALARLVHGMRAKRVRVTKTQRARIGERDGWICCICRQPTDPDIPWITDRPYERALDAEVRAVGAAGMAAVAAWVDGDTDRARAAERWYLALEAGDHDYRAFKPVWAVIEVYRARNDEYASVEHHRPVSMGGGNEDANLGIAHWRCNKGGAGANRPMIRAAMDASVALFYLEQLASGTVRETGSLREPREHLMHQIAQQALKTAEFIASIGRADEIPHGLHDVLKRICGQIEEHWRRYFADERYHSAVWDKRHTTQRHEAAAKTAAARAARLAAETPPQRAERESREAVRRANAAVALRAKRLSERDRVMELIVWLEARIAGLTRRNAIERRTEELKAARARLRRIEKALDAAQAVPVGAGD